MEKLKSIVTAIKKKVSELREGLRLSQAPARSPLGQQLNTKYGAIRGEAGRLSALVREAAPACFAGSSTSAAQIRERKARIEELTDAKAEVDSLSQDLGAALQGEKETLALEIHETVRVIEHLYENPLTAPAQKEQLTPYGAELRGLVADQVATVVARRLSTRALTMDLSEAEAGQAQLKLKARYLSGEQLKPEDLFSSAPENGPAASPPPTAPRAARRRTRR